MKGVSQVLTSTIILAVAISVAGVYSNWAPGFAEDITGETADQTNRDIRCGNAELSIAVAEYDLSGNFTDVELRNSGTIDFNGGIEIVTFGNESQIIGQETMENLEAAETGQINVYSDEIPERMAASSSDCPNEVVVSTDVISVRE